MLRQSERCGAHYDRSAISGNCRWLRESRAWLAWDASLGGSCDSATQPARPGSSPVASPLGSRHSRSVLQSVTDGAFNLLGERPIGRSSVTSAGVASVMSAGRTWTVVPTAMPRSAFRDACRGSVEAIWDTRAVGPQPHPEQGGVHHDNAHNPPEARLFAAAKVEVLFELSVEERRIRPGISLERIRASVAGLGTRCWRDPDRYCSLLDHGGVEREQPLISEVTRRLFSGDRLSNPKETRRSGRRGCHRERRPRADPRAAGERCLPPG